MLVPLRIRQLGLDFLEERALFPVFILLLLYRSAFARMRLKRWSRAREGGSMLRGCQHLNPALAANVQERGSLQVSI
ncbi:hypothetical protein B0H16DRAFT_1573370 [Mycena metata]|uniref:Uncharacterized protein n=1 Tax=Mycena metata TaxID=1033252 RepID=A0AAD7I938_9AGAR|nr:hypothetical protein B0H16DRAFT_1573370 [Mycena metata]